MLFVFLGTYIHRKIHVYLTLTDHRLKTMDHSIKNYRSSEYLIVWLITMIGVKWWLMRAWYIKCRLTRLRVMTTYPVDELSLTSGTSTCTYIVVLIALDKTGVKPRQQHKFMKGSVVGIDVLPNRCQSFEM